jgi:hypothetical protein
LGLISIFYRRDTTILLKMLIFEIILLTLTAVDAILKLCLILKSRTYVGLNDNVVQLIKAHSLHTLFTVLEKN